MNQKTWKSLSIEKHHPGTLTKKTPIKWVMQAKLVTVDLLDRQSSWWSETKDLVALLRVGAMYSSAVPTHWQTGD